jgi:hypothetical protein
MKTLYAFRKAARDSFSDVNLGEITDALTTSNALRPRKEVATNSRAIFTTKTSSSQILRRFAKTNVVQRA